MNKQRWAKFQKLWPKQSRQEQSEYLDAKSDEQRRAIVDRWIKRAPSSNGGK